MEPSGTTLQKRPRRSLRSILIVWFLLLSVLPVAFVTTYSVINYEKAINNELAQRLLSNGREITSILNDLRSVLQQRRENYVADSSFQYHLSIGDELSIRRIATEWMRTDIATELTFYTRSGRMLISLSRDQKGKIKEFIPPAGKALMLSETNKAKVRYVNVYPLADHGKDGRTALTLFSKVVNANKRHIGYLQQSIDLDSIFLEKLKSKMKVELVVLRPSGVVAAATLPDFALAKTNYFEKYTKALVSTYFEHTVRGEAHAFLVYPLSWGNSDFFIAMGASKKDANAVLKNVNVAFFGVVAALILFLLISIWLTSKAFLKPLWDLVRATQAIQESDQPMEIPVKSETEIGLLTEAFNQMNRNIAKARGDLKAKIIELEKANQEIRETQSKLVHNSKMISLGQLVAGVAHELNNPIGFIYSNMVHLKDYSDRLLKFAEGVEKNPGEADKIREELEIDYIKKDLPKLVASCEDGARRTRDIVLGLRNFSRLEAAQFKEMDINDALDSTLTLLKGEIKGRIEVLKNYEKLPKIQCFASQINQVFMNILSNAVQAIEGPGKLWITTRLATENQKGEMVWVSIQDSGHGMPPEIIEKIFDPFFSTKKVGQGTGLGLSITYGIVQNHGGDIQVRSQVGVGTEFIITLPTEPDESLLRLVNGKESA